MATKQKVPGVGVPPQVQPSGAPLYEATVPTFVDGRAFARGEQFRYAGKPSRTWKLIEQAKPAAKADKGGKALAATPAAQQDPPADPAAGGGEPGREADKSPI